MRHLLIILGIYLTLPLQAHADGVRQSGYVTPGHVARWSTNGVIDDAGSAANGRITNLGITGGGLPFCINDAPVGTFGGYHQMCLGANSAGGGLISYGAFAGASPLPLQFSVNGVIETFLPLVDGLVPIANLPIATGTTLGVVKGSSSISVASDGTITTSGTAGALLRSNNLSDVNSAATSLSNIGGVASSGGTINSTLVTPTNAPSSRTPAAIFGDVIDFKNFSPHCDGVTDDTAAANAARAVTPANGTIYVPASCTNWRVVSTPTSGPPAGQVNWEFHGTVSGTGTSHSIFVGSDHSSNYASGSVSHFRSTSSSDVGSVIQVNNTLNGSGGGTGFVEPSLLVNTTVSPSSSLNDFPWGILSQLTSNSTGPANVVGIASEVHRTANGSEVWGANFFNGDVTGNPSSASGPMIGDETDVEANGADDSTSGTSAPTNVGIRGIWDGFCKTETTNAIPAECGWGIRLSGSTSHFKRGYVMSGQWRYAAIDTTGSDPLSFSYPASAAQGSTGPTIPFANTLYVDVGNFVTGVGIPVGATVASLVANTSVTLSVNTTSPTASGANITFTANAPALRIGTGNTIDFTGDTSPNGHTLGYSSSALSYNVNGSTVIGVSDAGHLIASGHIPSTSNGTLNATASDVAGTVTEGTSSTGAVITFSTAYASTPDCVVTSPTGSSFTSYTPATGTLTIVNSAATGNKYTYHCIQ